MFKRIALLSIVGLVLATGTAVAKDKIMRIQSTECKVRSSASPLGTVVATMKYGMEVSVVEVKGSWTHIMGDGGKVDGWVHESALTTRKLDMKAGDKDVAAVASNAELANATKGFSSQVENEFKNKDKAADFATVDKMKAMKASEKDMQDFIKHGEIKPSAGGAK